MKKNRLKFMGFDHHRNDIAPFTACVLEGAEWNINGNDKYKFGVPKNVMTPMQIIEWITDYRHYFNDGIVISYLDRQNEAVTIVELITEAVSKGLSIMIETDRTIKGFEEYIGMGVAKEKGYPNEQDEGFYRFLGMSVLDFIIDHEYYVVAGNNRNMYVINPNEEDENGN